MTTIYLVRHGEYENSDYLFPGRSLTGFPLSERGKDQVKRLARYFSDKPIVSLYSSPILRCKQTAIIIAEALRLPVVYDDRLQEVRTMSEGISMKQFDTNPTLSYTPEYRVKGAESMQALSERVSGFIEEKRKEHKGKEILVVTHGDPMRFGVMKYMGLPITFEASRQVVTPLAGGYKIKFDRHGEPQVYPIVTP